MIFLWSLLSSVLWLGASAQNSQLTCPAYSLVNVSTNDINTLVFGAFPPDSDIATDDYNPGGLGPWYEIASGIINTVRPGSVTRDVVLDILIEYNFNVSVSGGGPSLSSEQVQDLGEDLARWWAGIIALTILGGFLGIGLLICCCCFGLCRCCGKCGGNLKQEEKSSTNCLTIVCTVILILLTCWLIAGVVLAFFSNQQVFNAVTEFEDAVGNTFDLAETFVNDSVDQIETLLCEVEDTFDVTVAEANALIGQAGNVVDSFSGDIYGIVDQAVSLSQEITNTEGTLKSINSSVATLQNNTASVNDSLQAIATSIQSAFDNCTQLRMTDSSLDCSPLDPSIYRNGLGANYFNVPDVSSELNNVQDIVSGINLTQQAIEGNNTYNSAVNEIRNLTNDVDQVIMDGLNELRNVINTADSIIQNFTKDAVGQGGYTDDGREQAETAFDFVRRYDTPRYAVGVVISCSAVVVVILVLLGVLCGMCGFRTDRAPYERTDISNCGGLTLLCAAYAAFLIGFFIMILSALVFFMGGVSTKFCEDFSSPNYVFFEEVIDNPRFTEGEYLLSAALFSNGSIPLTISGILSDCADNATVYQALRLENLDFIRDIQNFTNISMLIPDVSLNVSRLSDSINNVFESDTFVPDSLQTRIDDFTTAGVNLINVTQFQEQLNQNILSFNTTMQISQLEELRTEVDAIDDMMVQMVMMQKDAIISSINTSIDSLNDIETVVSSLDGTVDSLASNVDTLNANANSLTNSASNLLTNINATFDNLVATGVEPLVENASAVFPRAIGYGQQLVDFGIDALQNKVGNCRPISSIYSDFYNAFCSFTVDGLNGFWLALGMCGVLMIPIIIFSVITSHYYRRMKFDEDDVGIPYESSFPMKTY